MAYLREMRIDYELTDFIFPEGLLAPTKNPALLFDDTDVFLLNFRDHNNGIEKHNLHLPRYPAGRTFNPLSDRFAPAMLSTRTMLPYRENGSTASYKMARLLATFFRRFEKLFLIRKPFSWQSKWRKCRTRIILPSYIKLYWTASEKTGEKTVTYLRASVILFCKTKTSIGLRKLLLSKIIPSPCLLTVFYATWNLQTVEPLTVIRVVDEVQGEVASSEGEVSDDLPDGAGGGCVRVCTRLQFSASEVNSSLYITKHRDNKNLYCPRWLNTVARLYFWF